MSAGMEGLRDHLGHVAASTIHYSSVMSTWRWNEERMGDALLAPDGLLFPALRALGNEAHEVADRDGISPENYLGLQGVTGPLADACLAAAEVEP